MYKTVMMNKESDRHHLHGFIEKLFPDQKKTYSINGACLTVISEKPATDTAYRSHVYDLSEFKKGEVYAFSTMLNPTKRERVSGKHVRLKGEDALSYIVRRFENTGISLVDYQVTDTGSILVSKRKDSMMKAQQQFVLGSSKVEGLLEITDEIQFRHTITNGFRSRGKAYGFGMLNIIR